MQKVILDPSPLSLDVLEEQLAQLLSWHLSLERTAVQEREIQQLIGQAIQLHQARALEELAFQGAQANRTLEKIFNQLYQLTRAGGSQ